MKKKAILLAMVTFLLAACSNKGGVSSSASEGSLEEVVELMTEYSKLGSFRDGIVEDVFTKLTPDRATIECTVKVLIDRVFKGSSINGGLFGRAYSISAYAEDANGNSIANEFGIQSEQIDDYHKDLPVGTEVTLTFTTHPGFNQEPILTAHKIVLLWSAPIDDIDDEMGADEGSEMD